jgi:hypothetical protein
VLVVGGVVVVSVTVTVVGGSVTVMVRAGGAGVVCVLVVVAVVVTVSAGVVGSRVSLDGVLWMRGLGLAGWVIAWRISCFPPPVAMTPTSMPMSKQTIAPAISAALRLAGVQFTCSPRVGSP